MIKFLSTCGEENLQFLLHPPRLQKALEILDTDKSGEVDETEWDMAINRGLSKRLEQLAIERERRERAGQKADQEFSTEFLSAAARQPNRVAATPRRQCGFAGRGGLVSLARASRTIRVVQATACGLVDYRTGRPPARSSK